MKTYQGVMRVVGTGLLATAVTVGAVGLVPGAATPPSPAAVLTGSSGSYEVFLRNSVTEVGAEANGAFGSNTNAPDPSWHARTNRWDRNFDTPLGFVSLRSGTDWSQSSLIEGDFFVPGTDYEAWALQVGANSAGWNKGLFKFTGSTGGVAGNFVAFSGGTNSNTPSVVWRTAQSHHDISLSQRYWLPTDSVSTVNMEVTVTNSASVPQTIYYFRGVDADNCVDNNIANVPTCQGASNYGFTVETQILSQALDGDDLSAVVAKGFDGSNLVLWTSEPESVVGAASRYCTLMQSPQPELFFTTPRTYDSTAFFDAGNGCTFMNERGAEWTWNDEYIHLVIEKTVAAGASETFSLAYSLSSDAFEASSGVTFGVPTTTTTTTTPTNSVPAGGAVVLPLELPALVNQPVSPPPASTVAPSTTVPATTAPPVTSAPTTTNPSLTPGASQVLENGVPTSVEVFVEDSTTLVMRGQGFELNLVGECSSGCAITTDDQGRQVLELEQDGLARVQGEGFLPGTPVYVWLYSDPTFLGELTVQADGTFVGSMPLEGVEVGEHTLQVNGTSFDGKDRTANLGVVVRSAGAPSPESGALPATGGDTGLLVWVALLMVVGGVLVWTGRRPLRQRSGGAR